jgi:hypothetical protein
VHAGDWVPTSRQTRISRRALPVSLRRVFSRTDMVKFIFIEFNNYINSLETGLKRVC